MKKMLSVCQCQVQNTLGPKVIIQLDNQRIRATSYEVAHFCYLATAVITAATVIAAVVVATATEDKDN